MSETHFATVRVAALPTLAPYTFNPAIIRTLGGWAMALRFVDGDGRRGIATCRLDDRFQPIDGTVRDISAELRDGQCWHADPRVFWAANRMFMVYNNGIPLHGCNMQFVCELDPRTLTPISPARRLTLEGTERRTIEKNWQFFETAGQGVLAVYSIEPHVILSAPNLLTDSADVACRVVYQSSNSGWRDEPRGGTPPIAIDDCWWSFYHYVTVGLDKRKTYRAGAYCFDGRPPFSVVGNTALALAPQRAPRLPMLNPSVATVIYPTGAAFDDRSSQWLVSYGVNDQEMSVAMLGHQRLHQELRQGNGSVAESAFKNHEKQQERWVVE